MNQQSLQNAKELLQAWWDFDDGNENGSHKSALSMITPGWCWYGFEPLNALESLEAYQSHFLIPFSKAFPTLKREVNLLLGGFSNGRVDGTGDNELWVCGIGVFHGILKKKWLGIPASENPF